jgi:hypothetical protein
MPRSKAATCRATGSRASDGVPVLGDPLLLRSLWNTIAMSGGAAMVARAVGRRFGFRTV